MTACMTGWAHTPFGKLEDDGAESLVGRVVSDAIADAGLEPAEIDEIFLGTYNGGMSPQDFSAPLVLARTSAPQPQLEQLTGQVSVTVVVAIPHNL